MNLDIKTRIFFIVFLVFIIASLVLGLATGISSLPNYRDEQCYIGCGVAYVSNFTPPILCNFEHPPFAKYVIGFSYVFGFSRVLFLLLYAFSSIFLFLIVYRLSNDLVLSLFSSSFLFFDTLFFNTYRFLLLDPIAVFLSLASLYLAFSACFKSSAILAGLALASKLSSVPTILVSLYIVFRRGGFKKALGFIAIAGLAYLATYIADFGLGLSTVFEHHIRMLSYMGWRHGFSPVLAVIGFLKLLTKVEVWRFGGDISTVLTQIDSFWSIYNISTTIPITSNYIVVGIGMGSTLWYLFTPMLLYNSYRAMVSRDLEAKIASLWAWLSLLNIVAGPIDWYYANALPALYTSTSIALLKISKNRFKKISSILISIQITLSIATAMGIMPYRVELYR